MKKALVVAVAFMATLGFTGMTAAQLSSTNFEDSTNGDVDGGNTSNTNLSVTQDTTDWAGFYGTLNATVQLSDGGTFYQWTGGDVTDSAVLASDDGFSGNEGDLSTVSDPSSFTGVPEGGTDGINNTFSASATHPTLSLGETNSTTVDYGAAGVSSFTNYIYSDSSGPVYAAEAIEEGTAYDGSTADYQLLVDETTTTGSTSTFSFYAEIA